MIHFAYPNADIIDEKFIGCGRLLVSTEPLADSYIPLELDKTADFLNVNTLVSKIAPDSVAESCRRKTIYEKKDRSEPYRGRSKELAYLLTLIHRGRNLKFSPPGDIWCTGSLVVSEGSYPMLQSVDRIGFSPKLKEGFLAPQNTDTVFLVAEDNITDEHENLCLKHNVDLLSLNEFASRIRENVFERKIVVKVGTDELFQLVSILFQLGENPYKGLDAFEFEDAGRFFGRTELIATLYAKCDALVHPSQGQQPLPRILAVIGSSGSGKSSVVKAGLLPELCSSEKFAVSRPNILIMRPGSQPLHTLRQELQKIPVPEIVFIDQFEETYELCKDEQHQNEFINNLYEFASQKDSSILVIFTLRTDYLDALKAPLNVLNDASHVLVGKMADTDVRRAIEEPAKLSGYLFDREFTERVIDAVRKGSEGILPLLEFTLSGLWENLKEGKTPEKSFEYIGGIGGALSKKADELFTKLSDRGTKSEQEQKEARILRAFRKLTTLDEHTGHYVRVQKTLEEITQGKREEIEVAAIVREFSQPDVRFLTKSENGVEITHETIFYLWDRLHTYLERWRDEIPFEQELDRAITEWKVASNKMEQQQKLWWQPVQFGPLKNFCERRKYDLSSEQEEFFKESAKHQHRVTRRTRVAIAGLIILTIASIIGGLWANYEREQARRSELFAQQKEQEAIQEKNRAAEQEKIAKQAHTAAEQEKKRAQDNEVNALIQTTKLLSEKGDKLNALLVGIRTGVLSRDIELSYELKYQIVGNLQEIIHGIHQNAKLEGHERDVLSVAFSPNDKMIASGSGDETIKLWNVMNGKEILTLHHPKGVRSIAFSPDGTKLASTSGGPDIKLWNVADGEELLTFYTSSNYINEITFRPDGKRIASAGDNGVELWSVSDGKNMGTWGTPKDAYCVAFSSDSKRVAVGFEFNEVIVWNLINGQLLMNLNIATLSYSQIPSMLTHSIAFSPTDDNILAVADSNGVIIIDVATMQTYQVFEKSPSIRDIKFSPDGKTLLCGASDGTIQLWDILDRVEVFSLPLHQGYVSSVDFNSDGTVFVSGSGDETVAIGYSNADRKRNIFEHQSGGVLDVHFSPDDKFLVSTNGEETVFWNVLTGQRSFTVKQGSSSQIAISPNGKILAAPLSSEKGILLWDTVNKKELATLPGKWADCIKFNYDGSILASGHRGGGIVLWDMPTLSPITTLHNANNGGTFDIAFSLDGKTLVSGELSAVENVQVWDVATGTRIFTLNGDWLRVVSVDISPDGKIIATGGYAENKIRLWDVETKKEIRMLQGNLVKFSPDGTLLATAYGREITLWTMSSGKEIFSLKGHSERISAIDFNSTGQYLVSSSTDGTIRLWDLELDSLLVQGCNWIKNYLKNNPNLKPEERTLCDDILGNSYRTAAEDNF